MKSFSKTNTKKQEYTQERKPRLNVCNTGRNEKAKAKSKKGRKEEEE